MFGTVPEPEGITNPPIDALLDKVESKYALAAYSAKRARQINSYHLDMARDGSVTHIGPLVEGATGEDKPLSVALEEIAADKIEWGEEEAE